MQLVPVNSATNDRRFQAAVAAMQGLLALELETFEAVAENAVAYADALLAELDKEQSDD
jgi:hypothetical protein